MNLDSRARQAADGVRAATGDVEPAAHFLELQRQDRVRRRRTNMLAVAGVSVLVAGSGWLAVSEFSRAPDPSAPASTSTPGPVDVDLQLGSSVGRRMTPPMKARAPESWSVSKDGAYVNLTSDAMAIEINGPLLEVIEEVPDDGFNTWSGQPIPPAGYADWLRGRPDLVMLEDQTIIVDGRRVPQLTFEVTDGVPGVSYAVRLGRSADMAEPGRWPTFWEGAVITQTVIVVHGQTMVVTSSGAMTDVEHAQLQAATELVLSTMELPE